MLLPDETERQHLCLALARHIRQCRRDGIDVPASLVVMLEQLAQWPGVAGSGQETPGFAPPALAPDAEYVSVERTAAVMGLSESTVRRRILAGELPHRRVGRRVLIPVSALRAG